VTNLDAQRRTLDVTGLDDLIHHRARDVHRHGETIAGVVARGALDRAVDADHFAARIHERTTRVARVDGRIGLNEILNALLRLAGQLKRTALRADDPLRHGEREVFAERVADGKH